MVLAPFQARDLLTMLFVINLSFNNRPKGKSMKFKSSVIAVALAAGMVSAMATNLYSIGDLTARGDTGYAESFSFSSPGFDDMFTFTIAGGVNDFSTFNSKLSLKPNQQLSSFEGQLTGPSFSQTLLSIFTPGGGGSPTVQGLGYEGPLGAGDYTLSLKGTASRSGSYAVQLLAAPIPEPETYAMLLAGLGVIGTIAVRRRNRANSY